MADQSFSEDRAKKVDLIELPGEWFVQVTDGEERIVRSFDHRDYAVSWAEGQRIRLGLLEFQRI